MAKWRVRKYEWSDYKGGVGYGKRTVVEEFIEALSVLFVDSTLHFCNNYDYKGSPITKAMRYKGEWFAVDRIEDQEEASIELATTRMEFHVLHKEAVQPELA